MKFLPRAVAASVPYIHVNHFLRQARAAARVERAQQEATRPLPTWAGRKLVESGGRPIWIPVTAEPI